MSMGKDSNIRCMMLSQTGLTGIVNKYLMNIVFVFILKNGRAGDEFEIKPFGTEVGKPLKFCIISGD